MTILDGKATAAQIRSELAQAVQQRKLDGKKILVQGIGHVGETLVDYLVKENAIVQITDINQNRLEEIKSKGQKLEADTLLKATKMHLENKLEVRWRKVHIKSK